MAIFKPFKALRPDRSYARAMLCPPYDVVFHSEAAEICAGSPYSFMHVIRADAEFPKSMQNSDEVYARARDNLIAFEEKGLLIQDDKPSYYIYRQISGGRVQTGIVGCCSIDDYTDGVIKRHEITREEKEQDRINHFDTCNADTEPVFLLYKNRADLGALIDSIISESDPQYDVTDSCGVRHILWTVSDDIRVAECERIFADIPSLYIADGHHRTASAVKVGIKRRLEHPGFDGSEEFNRFMAVAFADDCINIIDYNRMVRDLNGLSIEEFLAEVGKNFRIVPSGTEDILPSEKNSFTMYLDGMWYRLELKSPLPEQYRDNPVESLDVSILQHTILSPVLGINDPRTDDRISFAGGSKGPEELRKSVDSGSFAVAFAVYPVTVKDIMTVADSGMVMPPKSTWFEPKLGSGWFIHKI